MGADTVIGECSASPGKSLKYTCTLEMEITSKLYLLLFVK